MILQKESHRIAKWSKEGNCWDISDTMHYRWAYPDETPASDWFNELQNALNWLIDYEQRK